MPTISRFYGVTIQMFWREHGPPHFHARYGRHTAIVDIRSMELVRGTMPSRARLLILEWVLAHQSELLENWDLCAVKLPPKPIDPLP